MKNKILLILILVLAFALRFWRLDTFPALNADEAALGYNAWSLLKTGMDEHGNAWPIHFQSFNDYKPGLYVYLVLPFVKVLGLTTWAVRIPGALAGVATVLIVYYLVLEISRRTRNDNRIGSWVADHGSLAIIASAMLAISPWHIHFSRGGWEVNVATFFITTGIWLFIKWINCHPELLPAGRQGVSGSKDNSKSKILKLIQHDRLILLLSALFFTLSLYTYHASRVIVPLLGLGLVLLYRKKLLENWKKVLFSGFVGLVLLVPLIRDLAGPAGLSRAEGVGIFSDTGPLNEINEQRGEHFELDSFGSIILHNKPVNYSLAILENWFEHYHGEFLFLSGDDIQRNKVPEHGQMYIIDALFVIVGLFSIWNARHGKLIILWLLVAPTAAALTFQSPHALRAQNMVVPLVIVSAMGLITILNKLNTRCSGIFQHRVLFLATGYFLLIATILWSFMRYQQHYWVHMPRAYSFSSQYGVRELMDFVDDNYDKYDKIIITDRYDQPYILALFYLKYPPEKFQPDHRLTERDGFGFSTVREFDKQSLKDGSTSYKFMFVSLSDWSDIVSSNQNALIAGTEEEIPDDENIIKKILFPNGDTAFEIVEN